jgi:hypothetical protein
MELIHTNIKNSFEPTPRLRSSPIRIPFVPFNINKYLCDNCEHLFSKTFLLQQFCKNCLFVYIKNVTNFDTYLDIRNNKYSNVSNIEEQFEEWSKYLRFKQVITNQVFRDNKWRNSYKTCKLCCHNYHGIICSNCYLIYFTWIESSVLILHLPWWDACDKCMICNDLLESESDYQKWCSNCLLFYIGCRYCLTTNVIFGITKQSQCMKCKRISPSITINTSYMANISEYFLKFNTYSYNQIANYVNNIDKNSNLLEIYNFIKKLRYFNFRIYYQIIASSENNNENSLNLIIPITFVPFKNEEDQCYCCKKIYSETPLFKQKYCKNCLYWCIRYATSNIDIRASIGNLDACIRTNNSDCNKHEPKNLGFCIQEWCENCSEVLYFNQIVTNHQELDCSYEKNCKLCGKLIYKQNDDITKFSLCSDCYLISFESIESTLTKKYNSILYLPWWDACDKCMICNRLLESKYDYQKWCSDCLIIYIGCRYCLTTNIIFGIAEQSQCKKCKRIKRIIPINAFSISGNYNIDEFLYFSRVNINQIADYVNNISRNTNPLDLYKINFVSKLKKKIKWIPYSKITNLNKIAEGGYGKIYKASIDGNIVAVKKFSNSQDPSKYFLNEVIY